MATNVQLEIALKEAQVKITALEADVANLKAASASVVSEEVAILREATQRTFRDLGYSVEFGRYQAQAKREIQTAKAAAIATTVAGEK